MTTVRLEVELTESEAFYLKEQLVSEINRREHHSISVADRHRLDAYEKLVGALSIKKGYQHE